ncbi:MAG: YncE family protein, partial [Actinobacteria bacterium]|nr:YncE family protein [Actinomycetota bacterium]
MRELERERQRENNYHAERERIRKELAEGDETSLRRAIREAKTKAVRRRIWRFILVLCALLLAAGLFLVYSPYGNSLLNDKDNPFARIIGSVQPEEAEQVASDDQEVQQEEQVPSEESEGQEEQDAADQPAEDAEENVYAATTSGKIKESLADVPERVYVPNVIDGTMDVIDPATFQIIDHYAVDQLPYHITPSWDMSELLVNNEQSSTFTIIDPKTGQPSGTVPAPFPYNFYYTPDGKKAIVVVERLQTIEFRDPKTWELQGSVYIPWPGVDHIDFSADGSYLLASSEYSG